jgi:hypothetical protein
MLDKALVLTTIFTIVDDTMKGSPMIQQTLQRPGPAPIGVNLSQKYLNQSQQERRGILWW